MKRRLRALDLDFQRPTADAAPRRGWLGLLAGVALLAAAQVEYAGVDQAVAAAREHVQAGRASATEAAAGTQTRRTQDGTRPSPEASARAQLDARWGELFVTLEGAAGPDVALLDLQANPGTGVVRVSGEARDFASLMAYVRVMEASGALAQVRLAGHETRRDHPQHPVSFTLAALWEADR